jgi:DNA-binding FrmR family transcriptional regulator
MGIREENKGRILKRLKKIEGQVRGIQKMIEENRSLDDILIQVAATKRAFDEAALLVIAEEMRECLGTNFSNCEKAVNEALEVFIKYASHIR